MIRVTPQPEPTTFDGLVRQPGRQLLKILIGQQSPAAPYPKRVQIAECLEDIPSDSIHPRWQGGCLEDLHTAYEGVCSYLGVFIDRSTADATVDHFIPVTQGAWGRLLAYEWSNYRLSALPANRTKGTRAVLDPFRIEDDWFQINLLSYKVHPNPDLPPAQFTAVANTIKDLGLSERRHTQSRRQKVELWSNTADGLNALAAMAPFLYRELVRQGAVEPAPSPATP
jgi:hypothetical protein